MKSEKEIRELIATLQLLNAQPCDCALKGAAHSFKCVVGGAAMEAAAANLRWVVGDNDKVQEAVDRLNEDAAKIRRENAERAAKRKGK